MKAKFTSGIWAANIYADGATVLSGTFEIITIESAAIDPDWMEKGFSHWSDEGMHVDIPLDEQIANAHLTADAPAMCNLLDILSVDLQVMFGERAKLMVDDINLLINKHRRT